MPHNKHNVYNPPTWKYEMNVEYIEIDFTGLYNDEDAIKCVEDAVKMGLQKPDKSIRALVYVKNTKTSPKALRTIKLLGREVQPKLKKSALVCSTGIVTLLMKIYIKHTGSKIKFFTDKNTAIKYLVND